jgi:hypothetical protein
MPTTLMGDLPCPPGRVAHALFSYRRINAAPKAIGRTAGRLLAVAGR